MPSVSNNMDESTRSIDPSSTSFSIETLQEIVRNCQRNEERLHDLKRHTRHERKKAERLLRETYQTIQERDKQVSTDNAKPKLPQSIEFFVPFDDNNHQCRRQSQIQDKPSSERINSKTTFKERQKKPIYQAIHSTVRNTHRVRFNIPDNENDTQTDRFITPDEGKKFTNKDDELTELSRRCENLLSRLHTDRNQATILENCTDDHAQRTSPTDRYEQSITLQQALELLRPEFISHSRQRVQRINHSREYQEKLSISPSNPITHHKVQPNPVRLPMTYEEMKQSSKKKYEQLPEVNDRLRQGLRSEIRRRNCLRAKIFRIRLRQHVLLHGRTNIDESLTMIDT